MDVKSMSERAGEGLNALTGHEHERGDSKMALSDGGLVFTSMVRRAPYRE